MSDEALPLKSHLLELRRRLIYSAVSVAMTTGVAFIFHRQILKLLMGPANQFEGIPFGGPVYTTMTEFISVAFKTSLLVGLFASLPFVLYQVVMFVSPGLSRTERRYLYILMPATLLAFLAGAAFGYYVMFPPMIRFLLNFGSDIATPMIRIGNYVNLILTLTFWMGLIFEMPVVIFFLAKIGVVKPDFLGKQRRYAIVVAFILGAIITPTFDPINQSLVAVPIIVLYELSIWLAKLAARGRRRADAVEAEQASQNSESSISGVPADRKRDKGLLVHLREGFFTRRSWLKVLVALIISTLLAVVVAGVFYYLSVQPQQPDSPDVIGGQDITTNPLPRAYWYREWYLRSVWDVHQLTLDSRVLTALYIHSDTYIRNYVMPSTREDFQTARNRILSFLGPYPTDLEVHTAIILESYAENNCTTWYNRQCYSLDLTHWSMGNQVLTSLGNTTAYSEIMEGDYVSEWSDWEIPRPTR